MKEHKQARRKDSIVISLLVPVELNKRIEDRVAELLMSSPKGALSKSAWIRRAIERDLQHDERSRRRSGKRLPDVAQKLVPPNLTTAVPTPEAG